MRFLICAAAILMAVVATPFLVSAHTGDNSDKVTICHRTDSVKNPYVQITVDQQAVNGEGQNDHSHHIGPVPANEAEAQALKDSGTKWGDIIPPFDDNSGLNWTDLGQAIFNNGCEFASPNGPTATLSPEECGSGEPESPSEPTCTPAPSLSPIVEATAAPPTASATVTPGVLGAFSGPNGQQPAGLPETGGRP